MRYRFKKPHLKYGFPLLDAATAPLAALWRARPRLTPDRVLIVRLDHLGDAVMTTAMLRPMREAWPHAVIDVLGSPWNVEVFRRQPEVRRVWSLKGNWFDRSGPADHVAYRNRLLLNLIRTQRYDLGLDPRGDARIALLMARCGIRHRVGYTGGGGAALLTWAVEWDPAAHEARRSVGLLKALGLAVGKPQPQLVATGEDRQRADELLRRHGAEGPHVVVHVGAGTTSRQWPTERMTELVRRLRAMTLGPVVLTGSEHEKPRAEAINAGVSGSALDLTGLTDFGQLVGVLAGARAVVSCDTGPPHLAAALGVPTVVLFSGAALPRNFRPIGPRVESLYRPTPCAPCELSECPLPDHPCLCGIEVADVVRAIETVLKE